MMSPPSSIGWHLLFCAAWAAPLAAQVPLAARHRVYCIAGQGADGRAFQYIRWNDSLDVRYIDYVPLRRRETMDTYARRLARQIDTTQPYSLVGVSFGGMLAVEMRQFMPLRPTYTVVIASAKSPRETPFRYRFMRAVPLYRWVGDNGLRALAPLGRRLFEPQARPYESLYRLMMQDKPDQYFTRAMHCMLFWGRYQYPPDIIHIHGSRDHTLPIRRIRHVDYVIRGAGHMLITTHAYEVGELLNAILLGKEN